MSRSRLVLGAVWGGGLCIRHAATIVIGACTLIVVLVIMGSGGLSITRPLSPDERFAVRALTLILVCAIASSTGAVLAFVLGLVGGLIFGLSCLAWFSAILDA